MPTYVAEDVLVDYTSGIYIIEAKSLKDAKKRIMARAMDNNHEHYTEHVNYEEILKNLRKLKKQEIIAIYGGG